MIRTILALSGVLSIDGARVSIQEILNLEEKLSDQCPRTISEVSEPLQTHFDRQRVQLGLMEQSELNDPNFDLSTGSTEKCTKRDVCLLMRQLDMDFYQRARAGTLTDMDFDTLPDLAWMSKGTCVTAKKSRGKAYVPVDDMEKCQDALSKKGLAGVTPIAVGMKDQHEYPAGCSIVIDNNKGTTTAYMNANMGSSSEAGHHTPASAGDTFSQRAIDLNVEVLCEHDRSLSEAAATYYSPYKLKPSMVGRPQYSTSCSFGMYAYLAKLKETKSSCAKILTYQTSHKFYSAQDALDKAEAAEQGGKAEMAAEIRAYVEEIRQKFVLIDTVANQWCPGIWNAAMGTSGGTCKVPRQSSWASNGSSFLEEATQPRPKKGGGRAGKVPGGLAKPGNADRLDNIHQMLQEEEDTFAASLAGDATERSTPPATMVDSNGKPIKMALSEDICASIEDETLAEILEGVPTAPPDFFRDATVPDGEHPILGEGNPSKKWIHE